MLLNKLNPYAYCLRYFSGLGRGQPQGLHHKSAVNAEITPLSHFLRTRTTAQSLLLKFGLLNTLCPCVYCLDTEGNLFCTATRISNNMFVLRSRHSRYGNWQGQ